MAQRERHSKLSSLLHDIGGKTLRKAIDHFCLRSIPDMQTFLNNKKHALFHLWKPTCCCPIKESPHPLEYNQWNLLFQSSKRQVKHLQSADGKELSCPCCFQARPVTSASFDVTLACLIIKSVCPGPLSTSKDIDIIRTIKNSFTSHVLSTEISETTFNKKWKEVKTSILAIAKEISQDFHDQIDKEIHKLLKDSSPKVAVLENTRVMLEDHMKDRTFCAPGVVDHGVKILGERGIIIYTGVGGSGKTTLAWETIRRLKEHLEHDGNEVKVVYLNELSLWNSMIDPTEKSIVLLDDCLGKVSFSRSMVEENSMCFNTIYSCVQTKNVDVVMTIRSNVLIEARSKLAETRLFQGILDTIVLDLSDQAHAFSTAEKETMLMNHLINSGFTITLVKATTQQTETDKVSIDRCTIIGIAEMHHPCFPLLCRLFCSQSTFVRLGVMYFQQPRESLLDDINQMRRSDSNLKICYCLLVYICLKDGQLDLNEIDYSLFQTVVDKFAHSSKTYSKEMIDQVIYDSITSLHSHLMKKVESDDHFTFIHTSILEAVAISVGQFHSEFLITHCCPVVLHELLVPESYIAKESELTLVIKRRLFPTISMRFLTEIRKSLDTCSHVIARFLRHRLMDDSEFSAFFTSFITTFLSDESDVDMKANIKENLFITCCKFNKCDVVERLLQLDLPQNVIDEGFKNGCFHDNVEVVDLLLGYCSVTSFVQSFCQACSFGSYSTTLFILSYLNAILKDDLIGVYSLSARRHFETFPSRMNKCSKKVLNFSVLKEGLYRSCKAGHMDIVSLIIRTCHKHYASAILGKDDPHVDANVDVTSLASYKVLTRAVTETIDVGKYDFAYELVTKYKDFFNKTDLLLIATHYCYEDQENKALQVLNLLDKLPRDTLAKFLQENISCKALVNVILMLDHTIFYEKVTLEGARVRYVTVEEYSNTHPDKAVQNYVSDALTKAREIQHEPQ